MAAALTMAAFYLLRSASMNGGELAPPLDDAFIHFHYAQAIASGHPFEYLPGEGYSSGATSLLWPWILAPFVGMGATGAYVAAVVIGALCLGSAAHKSSRVLERLGLPWWAGGGAILLTGPLLWGGFSGMEIGLCALGLLGTLEGLQRRLEGEKARDLLLWVALLALARPEGMFIGALAFGLLSAQRWKPQGDVLLGALCGAALPLLNHAGTGLWVGSSVLAKQIPRAAQASEISTIDYVWKDILWESYGVFFFGHFGILILILAALALKECIEDYNRRALAAFWLGAFLLPLVGMALTVPSAVNLNRYLMPGLALLVPLATLGARRAPAVFLFCLLPSVAGWAQILGRSASDIRRHHVAAAAWLNAHAPEGKIAVNDAGFVPFLTGKTILDMEGIVSMRAMPYAQAGEGSLLSLLLKEKPVLMAIFPLCYPGLSRSGGLEILWSSTLIELTSSGAKELVIAQPQWELLESGAQGPTRTENENVWDMLDVSDLDSEFVHRYQHSDPELLAVRNNRILSGVDSEDHRLIDGARRHYDTVAFEMNRPTGASGTGRLVMRMGSSVSAVRLKIRLGGVVAGWNLPAVPEDRWIEASLPLRADPGEKLTVDYWVEESALGPAGGLATARWWWVGYGT
jgi:hypothetical protein